MLLTVVPQLHAADHVEWRVVNVADGDTITCLDDGNKQHRIYIEADGRTSRATSWPIWNEAWDAPLISVSRESFERFVVGRLNEPGVVDELAGLAAA